MPVAFSDHAKFQLKKRKIPQDLVRKAIEGSDRLILTFKDRKLRQKLIGDKILEVVTKTEGTKITVITAYYLEEDL